MSISFGKMLADLKLSTSISFGKMLTNLKLGTSISFGKTLADLKLSTSKKCHDCELCVEARACKDKAVHFVVLCLTSRSTYRTRNFIEIYISWGKMSCAHKSARWKNQMQSGMLTSIKRTPRLNTSTADVGGANIQNGQSM